MAARPPLPDYKGEKFDGNMHFFPLWNKRFMNHSAAQPLLLESPQLKPPTQRHWPVSAMGFMQLFDSIPECNEQNWDQWDMQKLIDETNAKRPGRITPAMEAQLLKVEIDLGEYCHNWTFAQQALFNQLSQALEDPSILDNIDVSSDAFSYSRAMKMLRDQYELFLESNQTRFETVYRSQIENFPDKPNSVNIEKYFKTVFEVKQNINNTPLAFSITDRFISDTVVSALKKFPSANFSSLGFALSHDSQRLDLTYLQNRLRVEVASLPDVTSSKEAAPTASPPSDAPTAFVADRQPRGGGNWGRAGRNDQRSTGNVEGRGGRQGNKKQRQHKDGASGIPDWFTGDQRQWERWCENRRPGGKLDLRNKEKESKESKETQSRDKRKRHSDEEADFADAPPQAQKFCFNLEHHASGSDILNALADIGQAAQLAEPPREEAQSTEASSSESESEQKSDSGCKKRVRGRRSQSGGPDSGDDAKKKPTVKPPKVRSSATGFSVLRRLPLMLLALVVTCLTQLSTAAEVMFGKAINNIVFDSLSLFLTKVLQCVSQNNNRRFLSGTILLGIFVFLILISSTFSEKIGSKTVKISEASFEALFANATDNHIAQTIGSSCLWILSWIVDSGASCHICNDSSCFVNLKPCNVKISTAKSGEFIVATGIGDIRLNTWNEQGNPVTLILHQGYLITEARRNLLSVSSLKKEYITVLGVDNPVLAPGIYDSRNGELKKNERNRIPIEKVSNLYFVKTASNGSNLSNENPWVVMQRKLGYMPLSAIRPLVSRSVGLESLNDVQFPKDFIEENSMMGKAVNRDKPDSAQSRCSAPMEIVGWDIFGPCTSPSFGGHHYCAVFVDHFSRYCWVYMLKDKSEMPDIVKQFVADTALIRKDNPLLCLRRDNAGENVSRVLEVWLRDKGIRSEKSTPHEPWQNGKAENHIKVLLNIARTNMVASGLSGKYWARAITYAADISNVQYRADLRMTPFEALYQKIPDLSNFQPFGVECWVYVRPEQRNDRKFDARGVPGIYLGRATSENKPASVIHIPSKGTTSRAFVLTNNVVFGHKYPLAPANSSQTSGGVIDSIYQSASTTDLTPGNVLAVESIFESHLIIRLRDASLRTASHRQFVSYLIDAQDSEEYCHLLDAYTMLEDLAGFNNFTIESDVCYSADFKHKLVDPKNHADAMARSDASAWKEAELKEVQGLISRGCFTIVDRPADCKPLPTTMVYKYKYSKDNDVTVRKCRLCVRGDLQREGVDYFKYKTYSAVLNARENRVLCALAASMGWSVHQTDITQAFTYGELDPDVEIYCYIPDGFPVTSSNKVLKLERSVYGLKQAPAAFKDKLTSFFKRKNFTAVNDSGTV